MNAPQTLAAAAAAGTLARLLEVAPGQRIALPPHTTLDLVEHPKALPVPGGPRHAHGLLMWRDQRIPMLDVDALVRGAQASREPVRYALVVAYQPRAGAALRHGAIALCALPLAVQVNDAQRCGLPAGSPLWRHLALACFRLEEAAVPVVDTGRLFGALPGNRPDHDR